MYARAYLQAIECCNTQTELQEHLKLQVLASVIAPIIHTFAFTYHTQLC